MRFEARRLHERRLHLRRLQRAGAHALEHGDEEGQVSGHAGRFEVEISEPGAIAGLISAILFNVILND